ncbi:hypothetical protein NKR19_g9984 [Coniochaeta hoffmannii]|uniref:Uncharacterized protein n=1 Tax=Coniochaeta hoffmannii TaxID=91930 RepID=A0AA38RGN0_9PEZI|nr:hypothetical protein NKR19_g9984 [Coniochaeta hoffmannii]
MTPNQARVIEATVRDPAEPEVQMPLRDSFTHELQRSEHTAQQRDKSFGCSGCRRVLAWRHFTVSDVGDRPMSSVSREFREERCPSLSSDSSGKASSSTTEDGDEDSGP